MPLAKDSSQSRPEEKTVVEKKLSIPTNILSWVIENKVLELYLILWSWNGYQNMKRFIVLYYVFFMKGGLCKVSEHVNIIILALFENGLLDLVAPRSNSKGCFRWRLLFWACIDSIQWDIQVSSYLTSFLHIHVHSIDYKLQYFRPE